MKDSSTTSWPYIPYQLEHFFKQRIWHSTCEQAVKQMHGMTHAIHTMVMLYPIQVSRGHLRMCQP